MSDLFTESEDDYKPYIVPKNVKARFEFFPGIGVREIAMILLAGIVGLSVGFIFNFITGSILWVGLAIPTGAFMTLLVKPNPRTGRNTLDILKDMRRFKASPKRYYYQFGEGRGN
ncbi:PrgI family mobile element protein [Paenibacillus agilis]|uniref:PrgI family protein n=1 Tax=Paenibacillus agilis TaxID=3020863 RepID=A0A559IDC7_9BACL|nr:PrgI family protein [Paenibacillus agilis]TVX85626.1 PrgI family protein [Paenibacillus agilis]